MAREKPVSVIHVYFSYEPKMIEFSAKSKFKIVMRVPKFYKKENADAPKVPFGRLLQDVFLIKHSPTKNLKCV
jgi:hypothetical protein